MVGGFILCTSDPNPLQFLHVDTFRTHCFSIGSGSSQFTSQEVKALRHQIFSTQFFVPVGYVGIRGEPVPNPRELLSHQTEEKPSYVDPCHVFRKTSLLLFWRREILLAPRYYIYIKKCNNNNNIVLHIGRKR